MGGSGSDAARQTNGAAGQKAAPEGVDSDGPGPGGVTPEGKDAGEGGGDAGDTAETRYDMLEAKMKEIPLREGGTPAQRERAEQCVRVFKDYIDSRTLLAALMFPANEAQCGEELLRRVQLVLTSAPLFVDSPYVGSILSDVLWQCMGTAAGWELFGDARGSEQVKRLLDVWVEYLDSPGSLNVVVDAPQGWLSAPARSALKMDDYAWDPADPKGHGGFSSWNAFFSRRLVDPSVRPIDAGSNIVTSPCDAEVVGLDADIDCSNATLIVKERSYSLLQLFGGDESLAAYFEHGHVLQAFLSTLRFHRWLAPCAGRVESVRRIAGSYIGSRRSVQARKGLSENAALRYIAHAQTRGLVVIIMESGLRVAILLVGMVEVSSVVFSVKEGDIVAKGQDFGTFQYGGSTSLVFLPRAANASATVRIGDVIEAGNSIFRLAD